MVNGTLPPEELAAAIWTAANELVTTPTAGYNVYCPPPSAAHLGIEMYGRTTAPRTWQPRADLVEICTVESTEHRPAIHYPPADFTQFVPILFQNGPGAFKYSTRFDELYISWFHELPSTEIGGRFDNWRAAKVFCELGSPASSGQGADIRLALAPRAAGPGLYIRTSNRDGSEWVGVDPLHFARARLSEAERDPQLRAIDERDWWWKAYTDEAHQLSEMIQFIPTAGLQEPRHIFMHSAKAASEPESEGVDPGLRCEYCQTHDDGGRMLVCDGCARGFHTYCVGENCVPEGDWFCVACAPDLPRPMTKAGPESGTANTPAKDGIAPDALRRIGKFRGDPPTAGIRFLTELTATAAKYQWSPTGMLQVARGKLVGNARRWWEENQPFDSWVSFRNAFLLEFEPEQAEIEGITAPKAHAQRQAGGETPPANEALTSELPSKLPPAIPGASDPPHSPRSPPPQGQLHELTGATSGGIVRSPHLTPLEDDDQDSEDDYADGDESSDYGDSEDDDETRIEPRTDLFEDAATLAFLQNGMLPELDDMDGRLSAWRKECKRIRRRAANYTLREGEIYMLPTKRVADFRLVPPPEMRGAIIKSLHEELGHPGARKVRQMLTKRYYWRRLTSDIAAALRDCEGCMKTNATFTRVPDALRPLPITAPWQRVSVDLMGPFPKSRRGNLYIVVAVDSYTKWVEARAIPAKNADNVTAFFCEDILARHGTPGVVLSDRGTEFLGSFHAMLKENHIEHRFSPAYTPQVNGAAERVVRTITEGLRKALANDQANVWDEYLPQILLGIRAATHSSTGCTPFFLVHGREPILPIQRRIAVALGKGTATPPEEPEAGDAEFAGSGAGPSIRSWPPPKQHSPANAASLSMKKALDGLLSAAANIPPSGPTAPRAARPVQVKIEPGFPTPTEEPLIATRIKTEECIDLTGDPPESADGDPGPSNRAEQAAARSAAIKGANKTAEENMRIAQAKMCAAYKRRHGQSLVTDEMPVDSFVFMRSPSSTSKLQPKVEGPYKIVAWSDDLSRAVLTDAAGKTWAVHVTRLTPYGPGSGNKGKAPA